MNDFADWLSPAVVKELRQGLRSRAFVGLFLVLQIFMIFCILSAGGEDSREVGSFFFWSTTALMLLVGIPLRGLGAVLGEVKGNTLDLLLLTQLSAWRIIVGKWAALFLQGVLLVCSVLPYVVLRYYYGGIELVDELVLLGWILVGSALGTAFAVGISPCLRTLFVRVLLGIGVVFAVPAIPVSLTGVFRLQSSGFFDLFHTPSGVLLVFLLIFLLGPVFLLGFLEVGVAAIAPAGENHATRKRLLALAGIAIAALLAAVFGQRSLMLTLAVLIALPVCLGALMENPRAIPSLYRPVWPFSRSSWAAKIAGRILYPGWSSGLLFTLLVTAAIAAMSSYQIGDVDEDFLFYALLGMIFMPFALVRLFFPRKSAFQFFIVIQGLCILLAIVLGVTLPRHADPSFFMLLPTTGFLLHSVHPDAIVSRELGMWIALSVVGVSLGLLGVLSFFEWRKIGRLERDAEAME